MGCVAATLAAIHNPNMAHLAEAVKHSFAESQKFFAGRQRGRLRGPDLLGGLGKGKVSCLNCLGCLTQQLGGLGNGDSRGGLGSVRLWIVAKWGGIA